jgi:hypothetical protein
MQDHEHMPFGKYGPQKGDHRIMKDIPASYLLWMWDNILWNTTQTNHLPVREYIRERFRVLLSECPDYIPAHPPK